MHNTDPMSDLPIVSSRTLARVGAALVGVAAWAFFRGAVNAPRAFADSCSATCGFSGCCPGCDNGFCEDCTPLYGFCQSQNNCWVSCINHVVYSCCDYTQNGNRCTCLGTDGFFC